MKKLLMLLVVSSMLFLAGCGTKSYLITTKSGQTYTTDGKMEYDVKSNTYTFTNPKGEEVILNQSDVEVIKEKK